jgi:hypothetical protein
MRRLWDAQSRIHIETKASAECATESHVSLIGHCTRLELLRCLSEVENSNGFSNRILWIATRRSKDLPHPHSINWRGNYPNIVKDLARARSFVTDPFVMTWHPAGAKAWEDFYHSCGNRTNGMVGSILGRAEAHTLRLAMIYAVLDATKVIDAFHLKAAAAFWNYCKESVFWCFGEKTGDRIADKILWELRRHPRGITRTEIYSDVLNCNTSSTNINVALSTLVDANLVSMRLERTNMVKKPVERWFLKPH